MADNLKKLMGLTAEELVLMGAQYGLNFKAGMKKSQMASQLAQSAASGWMEVNKSLMGDSYSMETDEGEIAGVSFSSYQLSDAAHAAQQIAAAGMGESLHHYLGSGSNYAADAIGAYLKRLGTTSDEVWMHLPKPNELNKVHNINVVRSYLQTLTGGHQDIMPELEGHYEGDILGEYATDRGDVAKSFGFLAHMYVDRDQYKEPELYAHDVYRVAKRLEKTIPDDLREVGYTSATGGKASYLDALPKIGDYNIVSGIAHPRQPLNASGFPLGIENSGSVIPNLKPEYSLTASISGQPGWSDASKSLYNTISGATKSLAKAYSGQSELGMNPNRHVTSDRDRLMDEAARYIDVADVRSGYDNLFEPTASRESLNAILANDYDKLDATPTTARVRTSDYSDQAKYPHVTPPAGAFSADFEPPTSYNAGRARRESIAIANLDSASAVPNEPAQPESPVTYHKKLQQGSDEWFAMRGQYEITGSTVGSLLGHSLTTTMQKRVAELEGLYPSSRETSSNFSKYIFRAGHEGEARARPKVAKQLGVDIEEVGAITNSNFPNMMYSPDGLIGDDALWEHKSPVITKKFSNLKAGEHEDYMDQIQLGMLLSGRSKTLFSQTVGNDTRSEWIDADPTWYERNKGQLDSIAGRRAAVRRYIDENQSSYQEEMSSAETPEQQRKIRNRFNRGAQKVARTYSSPDSDYDYEPTPVSSSTEAASSSDANSNPLAAAVKAGILAAQEENKAKGNSASGDADFAETGNARSKFDEMMDEAEKQYGTGGGGRGNGGGGGNAGAGGWDDQFGKTGGAIARGVAGGTISSTTSGVITALSMTPWGRAAVVLGGAVSTGSEAVEGMSEYYGQAQDAGEVNPVAYASMSQGLEKMGLSESQAGNVNATVHSAYNTLLNGDPSGAIRIITGTRGLVGISEIRESQGNPVALARSIVEKGRERNWSQARIAGAMEMAGLGGLARVYQRTGQLKDAEDTVASGREADTSGSGDYVYSAQSTRASNLPRYVAPSVGARSVDAVNSTAESLEAATHVMSGEAKVVGRDIYNFVTGAESGGREYDKNGKILTSPTGAKGSMQVLDSTLKKPGYGMDDWSDEKVRNATPEERAARGREYIDHLYKHFNGDMEKTMAAYTDGGKNVDAAVSQALLSKDPHDTWLDYVPKQAQNRVAAYRKQFSEGAEGFTRNGMSYGQTSTNVNLTLNATINGQQSKATVSVPNGQTVTQQVNMGNGAMQRR